MRKKKMRARLPRLRDEQGTTLIETAIASGILLVTLAGLMSMGTIATMHTENQGHLAPRTAEYAQDKMEQLLALSYGDAVSDTVTFPAAGSGGSGLAVGGGTATATPVNLYVDWLAQDGSLLLGGATPPATWFYERVWQVTCVSATCTPDPATGADRGIKRIDVTVTVRTGVGNFMPAVSTVTALKAAGF
jgi:Flp pilus assembly protein TadG